MTTPEAEPESWSRAHWITQDFSSRRDGALPQLLRSRGPPPLRELLTHEVQGPSVARESAFGRLRYRLPGAIVGRRTETTRQNDHVNTATGGADGVGDIRDDVTHNRLVPDFNTDGGKGIGDEQGVRILPPTEEQLGPNGDDFS